MPIEMPKGLPFSVDTWTADSEGKRHHFLTHAHMDHTQGIGAHSSYPIYCTSLTRSIILQYYPQLDESVFVCIEVGQSLTIEDPDGDFVVTAFDANHCPGAVMFLYEGNFGNVLHTGDCRLTLECLQSLPEKYIDKKGKKPMCPLDFIFLDCTFGQFPSEMPSRRVAVQQIINCIWKHPEAPTVYLTCDMLGQEQILIEVSQTFGDKIYVDKLNNSKSFKNLELIAPEIISQDPSSRFHLFDSFPRLSERAETIIHEARANLQHEPLIIRPSTQWYARKNEGSSDIEKSKKERFDQAVRDLYGVWHVCYSIHSSKDELEWALQLLAPKWVVSTTPPCRALDLDYFKLHCFGNPQALALVQKLLDIDTVASLDSDETIECFNCSKQVEDACDNSCSETQSEPIIISTYQHQRKRLLSPSPSKRPMVTLFGRARFGFHDPNFHNGWSEKEPICSVSSERASSIGTEDEDSLREDTSRVEVEEVVAAAFIEADRDSSAGTEDEDSLREGTSQVEVEEVVTAAFIEADRDSSAGTEDEDSLREGTSQVEVEEVVTATFIEADRDSLAGTKDEDSLREDTSQVKVEEVVTAAFIEADCSNVDMVTVTRESEITTVSKTRLSRSYNENLRRVYRCKNVPVPQPLPSLAKLMESNRLFKRRIE